MNLLPHDFVIEMCDGVGESTPSDPRLIKKGRAAIVRCRVCGYYMPQSLVSVLFCRIVREGELPEGAPSAEIVKASR